MRASDARFLPPLLFSPPVSIIETLPDLRYVGEWSSKDGRSHVLEFAATLNGMQLRGVDIITLTPDGDKMIELEVRGRDDIVREGECLMTRRVVEDVFDTCNCSPPPLHAQVMMRPANVLAPLFKEMGKRVTAKL